MKTLILDKFSTQPLFKRVVWNTLTAIGWSFWLYLWSPLIMPLANYLGIVDELSSKEGRFLQELVQTYTSHILVVAILIGIFMLWSLLQWHRTTRSTTKEKVSLFKQTSLSHTEPALLGWEASNKRLVIHHNSLGQII